MSKKRTAAESNDGDETNEEDSDPVLHFEPKRAKITPSSNTKLWDQPIKLSERILDKAVTMEVRSMKLAKRVWNEKADLVISRLKNVFLRWTFILTTNGFLTEVHGILDGSDVATMKEEIFLLYDDVNIDDDNNSDDDEDCYYGHAYKVCVYDRSNMAVVKEVIALPGKYPQYMDACNVSNCLYVLCEDAEMIGVSYSVVRIKRDEQHRFNVLPWIRNLKYPVSSISVLPNGILSVPNGNNPFALRNYDANGSQVLSANIYGFSSVDRVIQKSNGNLVLTALSDFGKDCWTRILTEIDTDGKVKRQYTSSLRIGTLVHFGDMCGRIWISNKLAEIELLDSDLNLLDFDTRLLSCRLVYDHKLHYSRERNEIVSIFFADRNSHSLAATDGTVITTIRFIEE